MNESIQNLVMTSPPAEEPVSLAMAKLQCRVDASDTTEDALITALITVARQLCEKENRRAFVTRAYELRMNHFPRAFSQASFAAYTLERLPYATYGMIRLPKPPLVAVQSITYLDNNGDDQVLDPGQYLVDAGGVLQGVITPAYGGFFPPTRYQLDSVRIAYTAGYGAAADVPATVSQAMLLLIAHLFRNREAATEGALTELPFAVKALL